MEFKWIIIGIVGVAFAISLGTGINSYTTNQTRQHMTNGNMEECPTYHRRSTIIWVKDCAEYHKKMMETYK